MTRSQLIKKLRSEGFAATVGRIRQAIINGYVQPLPNKAARGAYDFETRHLRQIRWYMVHVRPGPRPQVEECLPISGAHDRMHRMIREEERRVDRQQRRKMAATAIGWAENYLRERSSYCPETTGLPKQPIAEFRAVTFARITT